ncbi:MAG: alpha/beta fold hydrolase [Thermodesulfobacteriota bacterium]
MSKLLWLAIVVVGIAILLLVPYWLAQRDLKELTPETRANLPGSFVKLTDGHACCESRGPADGRVVVLVHGATIAKYVWDRNIDALAAAGLQVIRYDNFGRGYSDRPHTTYGVDLYDRQLLELLDGLKVKGPVDLVGLSQGGAISVVFAARHPERVRKLVLVAPAGTPVHLPFTARLVRAPLIGDWIMAVFGRRVLLSESRQAAKDPAMSKELEDNFLEQLSYAGYLPALSSMLRNYPLQDLSTEYEKVGQRRTPCLLVWGSADKTIPIENAKRVQAAMPAATLRVVQDAGHGVVFEKPEAVNKLIVDFLTR